MTKTPPPDLILRLDSDWQAWQSSLQQANLEFDSGQEFKQVLFKVWACSPMLVQSCLRSPEQFLDMLHRGELHRDYRPIEFRQRLQQCLLKVKDEAALMDSLRDFRYKEMFRIAWRDLAGWCPLSETLRDLSLLADACVDLALEKLHYWACKQWGVPRTRVGVPQQLVVLGMGKLGAYELNFSSDIDLMFAYAEDGQTRNRKGLSHEEFFTRLGQSLINVIGASTARGFVFRVDMRLRPYGDSGALVLSFDAMEEYYQYQGREWERYAMIKARIIAGDFVAGRALLKSLRPFTYRRYLDYSAFESLRNMKGMIDRQVKRKGMGENIKLGSGGIREIEFIGQAFQLIRGGREPELQNRSIVQVLTCLAEKDYLPEYVVQQLLEAYTFLRKTENHMQAYAEQQTHVLPESGSERSSLAFSMGFENWAGFYEVLDIHRQLVQSAFEQVMMSPQVDAETETESSAMLSSVWQGLVENAHARAVLDGQGFKDTAYVLDVIKGLHEGYAYTARNNVARERMDKLVPLMLAAVGRVDNPDLCLVRVINLLESIAGRSTYLALLAENPMALSQVVSLFSKSAWIAEFLSLYPVLLDELLDTRSLYIPREMDDLRCEVRSLFAHIETNDLEQQMEALRYFKQSNVLHVAVADLVGAMSLVAVSAHLTEIAEIILQWVFDIAKRNLIKKHGLPLITINNKRVEAGFIIVGYGKLGGIELGYGSDLDLVFIYDDKGSLQKTAGPKVLENATFFSRLGQRIIHILDARTTFGALYEIDMRLRPQGASGLLVSDLETFSQYQKEDAWIWEHQALVRARAITGDPGLIKKFRAVRREVLCQQRDPAVLQSEVVEMRERMRSELGSKRADRFHIKQDVGGMVDIEFMVQYLVLRWAHQYPELTEFSDNLRHLNGMSELGILTHDEVEGLAEIYKAYRARAHRQSLTDEPAYVDADSFQVSRDQVKSMWKKLILDKPE